MPAHPRSRGENVVQPRRVARPTGSSPLTRGKPMSGSDCRDTRRLIPAHAGKTEGLAAHQPRQGAHPRSRGENGYLPLSGHQDHGSSPLTRGKQLRVLDCELGWGLIPAHAGKTTWPRPAARPSAAHPRSRGENGRSDTRKDVEMGSSPLTRGKHGPARRVPRRRRLIPAHAGKTRSPLRRTARNRAHPRSRGENRGLLQ